MTFPAYDPNYPQVGDKCTIEAIEKAHIGLVLDRTATYGEAAAILGLQPSTLWRKRKLYGLAKPKRGLRHEY
jgi:two-component system, NtrC family, response regulator AlgB